jgi:sarcosine oxidase subunit gamma
MLQKESALDTMREPSNLIIAIEEASFQGMITLRAYDLCSELLAETLRDIIKCEIPEVCKVCFGDETAILWMSPDELMIYVPYDDVDVIIKEIETRLVSYGHFFCVNVSDARAILRLSGEHVREVIAKGCPVDLKRNSFVAGDMRRTRIASVAVGLYRKSQKPEVFEVFCYRSYVKYLWDWLCASSKSCTVPMVFGSTADE